MRADPRTIVLVALISAIAGCQQKDDPRLATPKSAARTLYQAMYDNDVKTAKLCVIEGAGQHELAEGSTQLTAAMRRATDAAFKRYGNEFERLAGGSLDATRINPAQIDDGTETINGDAATIALKNGKQTLQLVRVGGEWKVDMVASFAKGANFNDPVMKKLMANMFGAMARAADRVKGEIEAGKHAGAIQAVQALMAAIKKANDDEAQRAIREYTPPR